MVQKETVAERRSRGAYPEDRFDRIARSNRVGAHRVTARPRYFWQFFIAGLFGFGLLTTAGVLWVTTTGSITDLSFNEDPTPTVVAVQPQLDPEATVVVLDGTTVEDLHSKVAETITTNEWGVIVFDSKGDSTDVAESAVMYRDEADEAAAAGLSEQLGGLPVYQTDSYQEYGARLIVVLGANYSGPGREGASSE